MINPQELRIGNWIMSGDYLFYHQISSGKEIDQSSHAYQPIKLTRELLAQLGFCFHRYFELWQRENDSDPVIKIDKDFNVLNFSNQPVGIKVEYLHQLQNVYFALKGAELPVEFQVVYDD